MGSAIPRLLRNTFVTFVTFGQAAARPFRAAIRQRATSGKLEGERVRIGDSVSEKGRVGKCFPHDVPSFVVAQMVGAGLGAVAARLLFDEREPD